MKVGFLLLLFSSFACAKFMRGEKVPLDRLVENVTANFAEYANQADAHYLLGRLESLAFSGEADSLEVFGRSDEQQLPVVATWSWVQEKTQAPPSATVLSTKTQELFFSSVEHYRQAIALDSKEALYHFSLGWMAEQAQRFAAQLGQPPRNLTGSDPTTWRLLAIREYREAYRLSEMAKDHIGPGPVLFVQSGQALIANLQREIAERKSKAPSKSDKTFIAEAKTQIAAVQADINRTNRLPRAITPLIFSTRPNAHLSELLSSSTVTFDLDGFTEGRLWPWLRSDTAMLVWDPAHEGHIVSGRQMFGSVTWWMFWKNGFEPLAALDNNGDGSLTGEELEGISVWQDRNGNGISDAGEVTPARTFGIVAIRVRAAGEADGVLAHRSGVILNDGHSLPLFDWIPRGVKPTCR